MLGLRTRIIACTVVVASAWLAVWRAVDAQDTESKPHRIGVVYGLTGPAQVWGTYGRMALELAKDEINQAGGVKGRPIELIIEDSKTSPAQSVSAYRKLVNVDKVKIVVGDVWDFITTPMLPLAARDGVLVVSPTVMSQAFAGRSPYTFTAGHSAETIIPAVNQFFALHPSVKRVGILCWDDPWGQAYLAAWRKAIEQHGATVAAELCNVDFTTDYRTDVLKLAAAKVDAIFIAHLVDVALKRIREQGMVAAILTTSNVIEDLKIKKVPPELFEGIYFTDWKPSDQFTAAFKARYGKEPVVDAHNSYDTLWAVARALEIDPDNVAQALRRVKFTGVGGELDFSNPTEANKSVAQLYAVRSGKIQGAASR